MVSVVKLRQGDDSYPDTATQAGRCREGRHVRTPFWNYVEQPNRDLSDKRPKGVSCGGGHRCGSRCPAPRTICKSSQPLRPRRIPDALERRRPRHPHPERSYGGVREAAVKSPLRRTCRLRGQQRHELMNGLQIVRQKVRVALTSKSPGHSIPAMLGQTISHIYHYAPFASMETVNAVPCSALLSFVSSARHRSFTFG